MTDWKCMFMNFRAAWKATVPFHKYLYRLKLWGVLGRNKCCSVTLRKRIFQNTSLDQNQTCSGIKTKKTGLKSGKMQAQDPAQWQESLIATNHSKLIKMRTWTSITICPISMWPPAKNCSNLLLLLSAETAQLVIHMKQNHFFKACVPILLFDKQVLPD